MKFSSHATVQGSPTFDAHVRAEPVGVRCAAEGSAKAAIGPIHAHVTRVPVWVRIPFLSRARQVAAVGPFDLRLDPVDVGIESFDLRCEGVLGPDGLTVGLEGGIGCKLEIDVTGNLPGRVAKVGLELESTEEDAA